MNRKMRRQMQKQTNGTATEKLTQQMQQFGKLPEKCDACEESFDKRDKEMLTTWTVMERQNKVRLFCPECMKKAREVADEYTKTKSKGP